MLFNSGYIALVCCFPNRNDRKERLGANHTNATKPKNLDNGINSNNEQNFPTNHIDESQPSSEITPIYINGYGPYLNRNYQQHSNLHPSFQNLYSSNSYNNLSYYDQYLQIAYNNNVYFNIFGRLPTFVAEQSQNDYNLHQALCPNERIQNSHFNQVYNANSASNILNHAPNSAFIDYKKSNETNDDKVYLGKSSSIMRENKELKTDKCNLECSENRNSSYSSNIYSSLQSQSFNGAFGQEPVKSITKKSSESIKGSSKILRRVSRRLFQINIYKTRFLDSKIFNESLFSIYYLDIKELNEISKNTKELCEKWIQREEKIEDSEENRYVFKKLYRLVLDVRNTINYFNNNSTGRKTSNSSTDLFKIICKNLKCKIIRNKNSFEKLKKLGIDKIFEENDDSSENNLIGGAKMRDIGFLYQDENSSEIHNFKITVNKLYYPVSLALFEDSIFLCTSGSRSYLQILKVDLNAKKYEKITNYSLIDEKNKLQDQFFGYGTRYTIIRSGSEGKLFLMKSPSKPYEKRSISKEFFEILVIDKNLKKLACIQVDTIKSDHSSVRPAILDFIVHNGQVYALDIKSRCLKIFNESLELMKTIPIPESFVEIKNVHITVSDKFIIIGCRTNIYYVKNDDSSNVSEFKSLELEDNICNIACYNEECIMLRFINSFYLLKIKENLSYDLKHVQFPDLNQLNGLILTEFTVKDNFLYCIYKKKSQIFKLNLISNTEVAVQ